MTRHSFHDHLPFPKHESNFRWRGKEVSRIEGLTDAVFAFAVSLLIVALEVPKSFDALADAIYGFPTFVACFALVMLFWNIHYSYFRRYGIEDAFTRVVTLGILLIILFSIYPLKFLFGAVLIFGGHEAPHFESLEQLRFVYTIYGVGLTAVWGLFATLYAHAMNRRHALNLNGAEVILTKQVLLAMFINMAISLTSVAIALLTVNTVLPGWIYLLHIPLLIANGFYHKRLVKEWNVQERARQNQRNQQQQQSGNQRPRRS